MFTHAKSARMHNDYSFFSCSLMPLSSCVWMSSFFDLDVCIFFGVFLIKYMHKSILIFLHSSQCPIVFFPLQYNLKSICLQCKYEATLGHGSLWFAADPPRPCKQRQWNALVLQPIQIRWNSKLGVFWNVSAFDVMTTFMPKKITLQKRHH